MNLMTTDLEQQFAKVGRQDIPDPLVIAKYFTPDAGWTWYATEYEPAYREFFGMVDGQFAELGYFALDDLERARGGLALPIERDLWWTPTRLSGIALRARCTSA